MEQVIDHNKLHTHKSVVSVPYVMLRQPIKLSYAACCFCQVIKTVHQAICFWGFVIYFM